MERESHITNKAFTLFLGDIIPQAPLIILFIGIVHEGMKQGNSRNIPLLYAQARFQIASELPLVWGAIKWAFNFVASV